MRIRQRDDSLELRSGNMAAGIFGGAIGAVGGTIGLIVLFGVFRDEGFTWFVLHPVLFFTVGAVMLGGIRRHRAVISRVGQSQWSMVTWLGLKRDGGTFNLYDAHHLLLHTDLRITRNKNGTSRRRVSTLTLVLRDGSEAVLGSRSSGGFGGRQPLLEQAEAVGQFTGVPLERTGHGAPPGYGGPGFAGPMGFQGHGAAPQQVPHPGYGQQGYQPPGHEYPGHQQPGEGHPGPGESGAGGGLPEWIRRPN